MLGFTSRVDGSLHVTRNWHWYGSHGEWASVYQCGLKTDVRMLFAYARCRFVVKGRSQLVFVLKTLSGSEAHELWCTGRVTSCLSRRCEVVWSSAYYTWWQPSVKSKGWIRPVRDSYEVSAGSECREASQLNILHYLWILISLRFKVWSSLNAPFSVGIAFWSIVADVSVVTSCIICNALKLR